MDIHSLKMFFLWCTVINAGIMLVSFLFCALAGNWIYRIHSRWFPISRDTFNAMLYGFLGVMKVGVILLNLVPYIALVIIECCYH